MKNKTNKTKKIVKILCAILLVVLLQTMGYTYAKYATTVNGSGDAEIAKWSFNMTKSGTETQNVKLISTANKTSSGKIAPGTSGSFILKIDATGSEVGVNYSVKFANEENKPKNIKFICDGKEYASLSEIDSIKGKINYDAGKKTVLVTINWVWQYETGTTDGTIATNDELDTQDANSLSDYTFDIIATGTQSAD